MISSALLALVVLAASPQSDVALRKAKAALNHERFYPERALRAAKTVINDVEASDSQRVTAFVVLGVLDLAADDRDAAERSFFAAFRLDETVTLEGLFGPKIAGFGPKVMKPFDRYKESFRREKLDSARRDAQKNLEMQKALEALEELKRGQEPQVTTRGDALAAEVERAGRITFESDVGQLHIFIDNVNLGTTDLIWAKAPRGPHLVRFQRPGYQFSNSVRVWVSEGTTTRVRVRQPTTAEAASTVKPQEVEELVVEAPASDPMMPFVLGGYALAGGAAAVAGGMGVLMVMVGQPSELVSPASRESAVAITGLMGVAAFMSAIAFAGGATLGLLLLGDSDDVSDEDMAALDETKKTAEGEPSHMMVVIEDPTDGSTKTKPVVLNRSFEY